MPPIKPATASRAIAQYIMRFCLFFILTILSCIHKVERAPALRSNESEQTARAPLDDSFPKLGIALMTQVLFGCTQDVVNHSLGMCANPVLAELEEPDHQREVEGRIAVLLTKLLRQFAFAFVVATPDSCVSCALQGKA